MSNAQDSCVIIGASHAGAQLAFSLRQEGWGGRIVLIGDEAGLPYHHPPLSKQFLLGQKTPDELLIRTAAMYEKQGIERCLGDRVVAIDRTAKTVKFADGIELGWSKLALCTGANARDLVVPGSTLSGVHYFRTLADAEDIRNGLATGRKVVIVGGGYIGLETAASLIRLGLEVTVLERAPRLLSRVASPVLSAFFERMHREEGVQVELNAELAYLEGDGSVSAVVCADGRRFPADIVIVGIGVVPQTQLAQDAGLSVEDGILIDAYGRTNDVDIVAAGDCTRFMSALYDTSVRLESVPNANDQAKAAAATLVGKEKPYTALPWFWSEQFDIRLQIAGLNAGYDDFEVRGDCLNGRSFSVFYYRQGVVIAADCVNASSDFLAAKRLVEEKAEAGVRTIPNQ